MMKSLRNLNAGDSVMVVAYRGNRELDSHSAVFLGFSDDAEKYGEPGPAFANFAALRAAKGYASFKHLDDVQSGLDAAGRAYGYGIYAWFQETAPDGKVHRYAAYRFDGRWAIGSSADRFSVR